LGGGFFKNFWCKVLNSSEFFEFLQKKGWDFNEKRLTFDEKCGIFYMFLMGAGGELLFKENRTRIRFR